MILEHVNWMISTMIITQNGGIQHYRTEELEQKPITDYLHVPRLSIVLVNITLQVEVKEIKT